MSTTVHVEETPGVEVTDERIEPRPPDRIAFEVEGMIRPTRALLSSFEGSSLQPVEIEVDTGGSGTVAIDLAEEASLRLESVDVGVAKPDTSDVGRELEALVSADDGSSSDDGGPGAVAFTVEGSIHDVPEAAVEAVSGDAPSLASITFSVTEPVETDGGSPADVLLEVGLLGFGVVVRRNGTIEIRSGGTATDLGLG